MRKKVVFYLVIAICLCIFENALCDESGEWFKKGTSLEERNDYKAALDAYDRAISYKTQDAQVYFNRARLTFELDPSEALEAIDYYTKGLEIDPANAEGYFNRGLLNAYVINNTQAVRDMKMAAKLGHESAKAWLSARKEGGGKEINFISLASYLKEEKEPAILFQYNSATLNAADLIILDRIGELMGGELAGIKVILASHACEVGTEEYNLSLSKKRGEAVRDYLVKSHGVKQGRIIVQPFGETRPVAPNNTEANRAKNRRVEIVGVESK